MYLICQLMFVYNLKHKIPENMCTNVHKCAQIFVCTETFPNRKDISVNIIYLSHILWLPPSRLQMLLAGHHNLATSMRMLDPAHQTSRTGGHQMERRLLPWKMANLVFKESWRNLMRPLRYRPWWCCVMPWRWWFSERTHGYTQLMVTTLSPWVKFVASRKGSRISTSFLSWLHSHGLNEASSWPCSSRRSHRAWCSWGKQTVNARFMLAALSLII